MDAFWRTYARSLSQTMLLVVHFLPIQSTNSFDQSTSDTISSLAFSRLRNRSQGNGIPLATQRVDSVSGFPLAFPTFGYPPPQTSFTCSRVKQPGFYADIEAGCQVIRRCTLSNFMFSFVCPNTTVFDQSSQSCDYWWKVKCPPDLPNDLRQLLADDFATVENLRSSSSGKHVLELPQVTLPDGQKKAPSTWNNSNIPSTRTDDYFLQWVDQNRSERVKNSIKTKELSPVGTTEDSQRSLLNHRYNNLPKKVFYQHRQPSMTSTSLLTTVAPQLTTTLHKFLLDNELGTDWIPLKQFT